MTEQHPAWTVKEPSGQLWIWCCGPTKSEVAKRVEKAHGEPWRKWREKGYSIVPVTIQEQIKQESKHGN